jgi:phosphoribosylglycinamide formyltransferase 1
VTPTTRVSSVPGLLVMISGGGRTLANLKSACEDGRIPATIAGVVASRECPGVEAARGLGIPVRVVPGEIAAADLARLAAEFGAEWVVLAGYLRRVHIPPALEGRVVNIHPALLPKFGGAGMYGMHVHRAVLAAGERESGCTVHFCDGAYDEGAIILQGRCPVLHEDTPEALAARVFEVECRTYPAALRMVLSGEVGGGHSA